jgi:hypothetical protein
MALTMRPAGLSSGIDQDCADYIEAHSLNTTVTIRLLPDHEPDVDSFADESAGAVENDRRFAGREPGGETHELVGVARNDIAADVDRGDTLDHRHVHLGGLGRRGYEG